ncbi:unnamed protein product [Paramecium octaurelia]|uniref:PARP catalytic domain-containing protein n=1 Tax=Paramecium octaurelia TaxID=43137 RepID=A0A8S1X4H6_PAROT|nr:unnamed protein product [Paramecium octaurelia]
MLQQVLRILQEDQIPQSLQKFEQFKIQNDGAKVLLERANTLSQSDTEMVCRWIINSIEISLENKCLAYNLLGCILDDDDEKIENFRHAFNLAIKNNFDISNPLINIQKVYLRQQKYEKVINCFKYSAPLQGQYKIEALQNVAEAYLGLKQIVQCIDSSKKAYKVSKSLFGINDSKTKEMGENLQLMINNDNLRQTRYLSNQKQNHARRQIYNCYGVGSQVDKRRSLFKNQQLFEVYRKRSNTANQTKVGFSRTERIKNKLLDLSMEEQKLQIIHNNEEKEDENQFKTQGATQRKGPKNNLHIYQLKSQNENNISQQDKMIYIQGYLIQQFLIESAQKEINFRVDDKLFQYQIRSKSVQKETETFEFFQKIQRALDQVTIFLFTCQSQQEAIKIVTILRQDKINKQFSLQLNLQEFELILSSEIDLNDFQCYSNLQKQASKLKSNICQIILIARFALSVNIESMQLQFLEFANNSKYFQLFKEQFQIILGFNPDANIIDPKIKQLQLREEQFEIIVSQPQLKIGSKMMFAVDCTIQFWMNTKTQTINEVEQKVMNIKGQINQIFFSSLKLVLNDSNQIKVWQNFLYQFYQNNPKEGFNINTELVIDLKGEPNLIDEKYKLIEQDLKEFQCKRMSFQVQENIAKILSEKQQYEKRFKSSLGIIAQSIGKCLIQIVGVKDSNIEVDIYINDETKFENISKQLQQEFFSELNHHVEKNLEIKDLYTFIGLSKEQFLEQYQVVVSKCQKEYHFISLNQYLDQIKIIIINTQKYKKENRKTKILECPNILVFNLLKEQQIQQSSIPNDDIQIIYSQNQKIILQGINEQELGNKLKSISQSIQQLENQLTSITCTFQEKQVKFFEKHFKQYCNNLENDRKASIKFHKKINYSLISQVLNSSKSLQLVQTNVILLECDAIVNFIIQSEDKTTMSDLSKRIIDFGGQIYQKSVLNQIKNFNKTQKQFDINTYEFSSFRNIHYIINVVTSPQFTKNIYHYETIKQILDGLFLHIKDSLDIRSLAMTILDDTENQYSDNYSLEIYLKTIINHLFNDNQTIKKVYLAEEKNSRIVQMNSILLNISKCYQPKYQWQWQHYNAFVNYDEDANKQIDEAYERFLQSGQETIIQLKFPLEKKPSTHFVDLQSFTIKDLSSQIEYEIVHNKNIQNNQDRYFINNKLLNEDLIQYFNAMKKKNHLQFEIFWKNLNVVINNQRIFQMNNETQYQRAIQKLPSQQEIKVANQQIAYQLSINSNQESQNQFQIESFNQNLNKNILKEIKQFLESSTIKLKVDIPQISEKNLNSFCQYLETIAQKIIGKIIQGQQIQIVIFKNKQQKLLNQLEQIKNFASYYPKKWIKQEENYIKVPLQCNSKEYNKIIGEFKKTDIGKIKAIFRIQNKTLWNNYIIERNKLFEICEKQNKNLLPIEKKRYLWHGVSSQHPKVIYTSLAEAFDVTFSKVGLWGQGIYFAENASYSRNYSYKLTNEDDSKYANNLVFLYCLVTTGKAEKKIQSVDIRKPSEGYDSVTGLTRGSNIFVLYQMHVRRVYPAYEVIFS